MPFSKFGFHPQVADGLSTLGYEVPTPIQTQSIPPVMAGRDVLGLAQTGTGKTAAFILPILHRLMNGPRGRLRVLIIAPTRELAEQTHDFVMQLAPKTGIRSITIYGGVGMQPQVEKLRKGIDIVVACPGRLLDHLKTGTCKLDGIQVLVLDEADRMFDMGFLPDIRRILKFVPAQRQTLLYSATMPDDIRHLIREVLKDEVVVQIGHDAPLETVAHALYPVPMHLKTALLLAVLKRTTTGSVLVFTRTKHRAKKVARQLRLAGHTAAELQGNLSQNRRQEALDGFRDGTYKIMVATDIAARGIDVSLISHVVNYDIPDTTDAYTHRIGRTGRAERTGEAYTFVSDDDDEITVRAIERVLKQRIARRTIEGFDYQQAVPPREPGDRNDGKRTDRRGQRGSRFSPRPAPAAHQHAAAARPAASQPRRDGQQQPSPEPYRSGHAQRQFAERPARPQHPVTGDVATRPAHPRRVRQRPAAAQHGGQRSAQPQSGQQRDHNHRRPHGQQPRRDGQPPLPRGILKPALRTQPLGNFIPKNLDFTTLED